MSSSGSKYWSARINRRTLLRTGFTAGVGLAGAALIGCGGGEDKSTPGPAAAGSATRAATAAAAQPKPGGTLRVALPAGPTLDSLDLNRTTGTWTHLEGLTIYDTLVVEDKDKNLVGSLAESWEAAPDNLSVTLKLKKGVKFHDGSDFKSENVKYLLDRVSDKSNNKALAWGYLGPNYSGTDLIDDYTAKINLKAPNFTMLRRFTRAYFGVPSKVAAEKIGNDQFARNPVGSGPWSLSEWVINNHETMKKFPAYNWAPKIFAHQGAAYLDAINFVEIPDPQSRASALESGDIDVMEEVPPVSVAQLSKDNRFKSFKSHPQGEGYLIRINSTKPPTDDLRVRQALEYAINRDDIIRVVWFGLMELGSGPLASSSFGFDSTLKSKYPFDPKRASELLDAAGWKPGSSGLREKDGQQLNLSYFSVTKDTAELVQAQLKKVGIGVTISIVSAGTQSNQRTLDARDHLTDGGTQSAGFLNEDPDILRVVYDPVNIGSQSSATFMGYKSDELQSAVQKQQQVPDRGEERVALLKKAQQLVMDAAIIVPVFDPTKYLLVKKNVEDIKLWPVNFYSFFYDTYLS